MQSFSLSKNKTKPQQKETNEKKNPKHKMIYTYTSVQCDDSNE